MLETITKILMDKGLVTYQWQTETQQQGDLVQLFRNYYDGFHRMQLTSEMKAMLNISDERLERYNINYCALIIDRMADRLKVDRFEVKAVNPMQAMPPEADGTTASKAKDPAQEWVDELMEYNRFDKLQSDIAVAYLRDGMTFVMSQYDDVSKREVLAQEMAYDGDTGMIVVYERGSTSAIAAAVKIWYDVPQTVEDRLEGERNTSLYKRVNIYYPNQTDKYYSTDGITLVALDQPQETVRLGKAPGVPVTAFYNKGGISELTNVIPMQDSLNSALVDLVMAGRLTAFSVFFAVGVNMPKAVTPGMTIFKNIVDANGAIILPQNVEEAQAQAAILGSAKLERIQGGDLSQIIAGIELIINQIGVISSTPLPGQMGGDSASGEALKQREIGMLGKLNRAQVQIGNPWEDAIELANMQQTLFGDEAAPTIDKINTRWKSAEIRNDTDVLALFKLLNDAGYERAALRALGKSSLASYSEDDIEKMMQEKAKDVGNKLIRSAGNLNGFDNFNIPTN